MFAAALALFFAPALRPSVQFLYRDNGRMHEPTKRYIASELRAARFPQWNPYAGLGAPVVGGAVDAPQHPFNALFLVLPFELAFKLWILLCYPAAALGAYAWARLLGLDWTSALLAGFAYALSGVLVSSSDNVTYLTSQAALPWLLAAAHAFVRRGGPGRLALVGVASAALASAGDPAGWGLAVLIPPLQGALLEREGEPGRWRGALRGAVAAAASAVAAAPFVLPVVLWLGASSRAAGLDEQELLRWNLHPARLLEWVVPGAFRGDPGSPVSEPFAAYAGNEVTPIPWSVSIYAGAAVALLALLGASRSGLARALLAAAGVFAWMAMGANAGFGQLARRLPVLGAIRYWEKLAIWPAILFAIAAGFGLAALREREAQGRLLRWATAAASASLAGAVLLLAGHDRLASWLASPGRGRAAEALVANLQGGLWHAGAVAALLALVCWGGLRGWLPRRAEAAALVAAVDLAGANAGAYVLGDLGLVRQGGLTAAAAGRAGLARVVTPFAVPGRRWPELSDLENTWRWGSLTLAPAWNVPARVGNLAGYLGLRDARMARLMNRPEWLAGSARSGLWGVGFLVVPGDPENARKAGLSPPWRVAAADPELPTFLLEIPHRPRAYLARTAAAADEEGAFTFAAAGGTDGAVVVEGPVAPASGAPSGEARVIRDEPGRTEVEVTSDRDAVLVLNDAWAPGWSATVDGRSARILRANYLVRAVTVPAGLHRVLFRYRTPGLALGWGVAGAGALLLASWALGRRRPPA